MLSILIPVFQVDVRNLVTELHRQCRQLQIVFEIRCVDDFSDNYYRNLNRTLSESGLFPEVHYFELPHNIGRSAIRNLLADQAANPWLWFLDSDSDISLNPSVVKKFWDSKIPNGLVSGGRIYEAGEPEDPDYLLHWTWGSRREMLDPRKRMSDPVNSFLSNNFIIPKNVFEQVRFETELDGYGYEDTFFASELYRKGFQIVHFLNPVLHKGIEPTSKFLQKIRESLQNLIILKKICDEKQIPFPVDSKLLRLNKILLMPIIQFFANTILTNNINYLEKKLLGNKKPNLFLFDLYRLAYLFSISFRSK